MPVVNYDPAVNDKTVVLWANFLETTSNNYSGHSPGHSGANALTDSTFDYWQQDGSSNTAITRTGSNPAINVGAVGVSGHTLGTTGSTFAIQVSPDSGATWGPMPGVPAHSPVTDQDFMIVFPEYTEVYWRILIFGGSNAIVSNLKLGRKTVFPCTPVDSYAPVHHSSRYKKEFNRSIKGHLLGNRVQSSGFETTCEFPFVARDFVDGPLTGFENHYNRGRPFFYAGWPNGKPQDMGYAWAGSEDAIVNVTYIEGDKLADLSFSMQGYVPV